MAPNHGVDSPSPPKGEQGLLINSDAAPLPRRAGQHVSYGATVAPPHVPALQIVPPSARGSGSVTPRPGNAGAGNGYAYDGPEEFDDLDTAQLRSSALANW